MSNKIFDYYRKKESRWGYRFLLGGVRHFGYYPEDEKTVTHRQAQQLMVDKIGRDLALSPGASILDAGCGEGSASIYLAENYGYNMVGLDILPESIQRAHSKVQGSLAVDVDFQVGDYSDLPFEDNKFDGIFTLETLVHSPDINRTLNELRRVLKPGGRLIMHEYTISSPDQISDPSLRQSLTAIIEGSGMYSLPDFTHGSFKGRLESIGFQGAEQEDITQNTLPMLRYFSKLALVVYPIIQFLGLEAQYPNITTGGVGVALVENDHLRYMSVRCQKPTGT